MENTSTEIEIVVIPQDLALEVERRHFEYFASLHIVSHLMTRDDVREDLLQKYLDSTEMKYAAVEMMKQRVTKEFPSQNGYKHYVFDFDHSFIKYSAEEFVLDD